jgi:hypothetical protein
VPSAGARTTTVTVGIPLCTSDLLLLAARGAWKVACVSLLERKCGLAATSGRFFRKPGRESGLTALSG